MEEQIKNKMRVILNKHDPMGIFISKEVNQDEYDPEIICILKKFEKYHNLQDFQKGVYQVFQKKFGKNIIGSYEKYKKISKELYDLLKKNKVDVNVQ